MTDLRSRMVEAMARAQCVDAGLDPNELMANGETCWRYCVPRCDAFLTAALAVLDEAGWVVVPKEPTEAMVWKAGATYPFLDLPSYRELVAAAPDVKEG